MSDPGIAALSPGYTFILNARHNYLRSGNITTASDASTSASSMNSLAPGRSPRNNMPDKTPTTGTGNDESELIATGSVRAMRKHAQCATVPARKMLNKTANHAVPDIVASDATGCRSNNGAASTSGIHPSSIIHPVSVFCGTGGAQRRNSTVPKPHDIAAPMMRSAPTGARCTLMISSPSRSAMPPIPTRSPTSLRPDSGSCNSQSEKSTLQIGIVKARIADRPAGICWTPNSISPFQPAILNKASAATLLHSARGMRVESPDSFETSSNPSAANGSVVARKVSGASSVTPSLSTGQLQPQTSVRMATSNRLDAGTA